jgi:hypothetical protein
VREQIDEQRPRLISSTNRCERINVPARGMSGGVPIGPQRQNLARGVDILVATPGCLLGLIDIPSLSLSSVQVPVPNYRVPSSLSPTIRSCPSASFFIRYRGLCPAEEHAAAAARPRRC